MVNSASSRNLLLLLAAVLLLVISHSDARSPFLRLNKQTHGYEGVVVAVTSESKTDRELRLETIESIKRVFIDASRALHVASREHVHFSKVTIVVPSSWEDVEAENGTYESLGEADFRVDDYSDMSPKTIRAEGCGGKSEVVLLNANYVKRADMNDKWLKSTAKSIVKEWAQLRYGVFEECGDPANSLYPPLYYDPSDGLSPTACLNVHKPSGHFRGTCDVDKSTGKVDRNCEFYPSSDLIANSSLMSMHLLEKVEQFCDESNHNHLAPTKQNSLCKGKSVWEVIQENEDFTELEPNLSEDILPTFKVVRPSSTNYVLLLDTSKDMGIDERYGAILASLRKFGYDHVPTSSALSMVTFDTDAQHVVNTLKVSGIPSRKSFDDLLPGTTQALESDISNAINFALQKIEEESPETKVEFGRKVLILLTSGKWIDEPADIDQLCTEMSKHNVRLHVLLYGTEDNPAGADDTVRQTLQALTACTSGEIYLIVRDFYAHHSHVITMTSTESALLSSIGRYRYGEEEIVEVHQHYQAKTELLQGSFTIDQTVGSETHFDVIFPTPAEFTTITGIEIISADFKQYSIPTSSEIHTTNFGMNTKRFHFQNAAAGRWVYKVTKSEGSSSSLAVRVTSRGKIPIHLKCWTSAGKNEVDARTTPVIIYAQLEQDQREVLKNVQVSAIYKVPRETLGETASNTVTLRDDGLGDPDIATSDGIYSGKVTWLPSSGLYSVTVTVTSLREESRLRSETSNSNSDEFYGCTRRTFKERNIGYVERTATCGTFLVSVPTPEGSDVIPPNRVNDLRIETINSETREVFLSWTSVGDDYDSGNVQSYEIGYSEERKQLEIGPNESARLVTDVKPPHTKETHFVRLPKRNTVYYIAVRGKDDSENIGHMSNIVTASIPEPSTTTSQATTLPPFKTTTVHNLTGHQEEENPEAQKAGVSVGAIVGIVIAAILILIIVAIVFVATSRKKQKKNLSKRVSSSSGGYSGIPTAENRGSVANEKVSLSRNAEV